MQKVIGINFCKLGKIYYFLPNNIKCNVGDSVVVDYQDSLLVGNVVFGEKLVDLQDLEEPTNKVLRLANKNDLLKVQDNKIKEKEAVTFTKKKATELKLDMKIVGATYSLDGSKVIIDFTAEERVDFRDLLKELAAKLKTRIELRQIGQRDEVKIKGGIGPCGEICCCKRFLNDFEHVTVKMAKNQGLSLSPTKISGLCGRLMCCLGYENPHYEEVLKLMPKINASVNTPDGEGVAVYNDILRQQVTVKFIKGDDTASLTIYPLSDIKILPKKENKNGVQNKSK